MPICAYCDQNKKLTREHVIAHKFLSKYYPDGKGKNKQVGYQNKTETISSNFQIVRDVCSDCNGIHLSQVDEYFLSFYKENFDFKIKKPGQTYTLSYDYNKLSRWLLKTLYNSERANKYDSTPAYLYNLRKYMLGEPNNSDMVFELYYECLSDHEKIPTSIIYRNSLKNGLLKMGNAVFASSTGYPNIRSKYFISGNNAFFLFFTNKKEIKDIEAFVSDLDYFHCLKLYRIDPDKSEITYKVSEKTAVDIERSSLQGPKSVYLDGYNF
ncbi:hypothetical protein [Fibrobacter sp. UBA4297]|uniref:hypothetical protein n=1 Tax=Fibrobacter sp. UBA4297 TaxID=1946536 RepID=UPI0025BC728F|nr:hypothetical protein [Fibrobacter sp. UBA4297]